MDFPATHLKMGILGANKSLEKALLCITVWCTTWTPFVQLHNRMTPKVNDSLPLWLRNSISFCVAWSKIQRECSSTLGVKNTRAWHAQHDTPTWLWRWHRNCWLVLGSAAGYRFSDQLKETTESLPLTTSCQPCAKQNIDTVLRIFSSWCVNYTTQIGYARRRHWIKIN